MTESEKIEFETKVYETKCKCCKRLYKCLWLKKRKKETCYGVFFIEDKRKLKKSNENGIKVKNTV